MVSDQREEESCGKERTVKDEGEGHKRGEAHSFKQSSQDSRFHARVAHTKQGGAIWICRSVEPNIKCVLHKPE